MAVLYYQGHGSFRITADDGRVIYVDPYAGDGYDLPADVILVTHQHRDYNQVQMCAQKAGCRVITNEEALAGGKHQRFDVSGIQIEAVMAKNLMHSPKKCVGYIVTLDGAAIYAAGDTSHTPQMETFAVRRLDYALFPCDGVFNMNPKEAAQCAEIVGARHNIPIHMKPGELFDPAGAEAWTAPNKVVVAPGEELVLTKA